MCSFPEKKNRLTIQNLIIDMFIPSSEQHSCICMAMLSYSFIYFVCFWGVHCFEGCVQYLLPMLGSRITPGTIWGYQGSNSDWPHARHFFCWTITSCLPAQVLVFCLGTTPGKYSGVYSNLSAQWNSPGSPQGTMQCWKPKFFLLAKYVLHSTRQSLWHSELLFVSLEVTPEDTQGAMLGWVGSWWFLLAVLGDDTVPGIEPSLLPTKHGHSPLKNLSMTLTLIFWDFSLGWVCNPTDCES